MIKALLDMIANTSKFSNEYAAKAFKVLFKEFKNHPEFEAEIAKIMELVIKHRASLARELTLELLIKALENKESERHDYRVEQAFYALVLAHQGRHKANEEIAEALALINNYLPELAGRISANYAKKVNSGSPVS